jgi:histidyl-tRNA synthetase
MTRYQRPKGTHDILPEDQPYWYYVRNTARTLAERMGFERIDTPGFEFTPVFAKTAAGEGTDLSQEMYSFEDKDGQNLTLRAEFTAGVMRAYIENGMHVLPQPVKLYSFGSVYRHEKPQKGRYREHQQFNAEIMGTQDPLADLEILLLAESLCAELGSKAVSFQVNSTGCPACKPGYIDKLVDYLQARISELATIDRERLKYNPLRVLDSKEPGMDTVLADAPHITDYLCDECRDHFAELRTHLDHLGKTYTVNFRLVRGLDYYTKTVFEVWGGDLGAQNALFGGGRYDGLAETLGGPSTPGVGFGSGLERHVMTLQAQGIEPPLQAQGIEPPPLPRPSVFVTTLGEAARPFAIDVSVDLREAGIGVWQAFGQRGLRSQLREANKRAASYVVILGQDEVEARQATVRDMTQGKQHSIALQELVGWLSARISQT